MQLKQISIYGQNNERRDVYFKPSQVNIITGASKKGKSSLIDIVEYCLGSSECNVAEGHIRDTVTWYALLLSFPDTQVFIARAAPLKGKKTNTSCYLSIGKNLEIPISSELKHNNTIDGVVDFLSAKIGIPDQITEVPDNQSRSAIKVGFKHSRYYLFQGQDEVAAKRTLFHRQSEPHIPQAIKDTLPYFLGAAEDDRLADIYKLRTLKRTKSIINKRIKEIESIKGDGLKKGFDLLAEAKSVGLYRGNLTVSDLELIHILNTLVEWTPDQVQDDDPEEDSYYNLERRYLRLREEKKFLRSKIRSAKEYKDSMGGVEGEINEQSIRLRSIGLYKSFSLKTQCPVCQSEHSSQATPDNLMYAAIEKLENKLEGVSRNMPRVTEYLAKLEERDRELADELKKTRDVLEKLRRQKITISSKLKIDEKRSRTIGRISLYLESIDWNEDTESLKRQILEIDPRIDSLEKKLDQGALKERLESQLSCISEDMTKWARELELEHCEHPIRLDISKLTVVAETSHGRTPLYRMGSGENWVGYHLVTYLALAKWFIEQSRPVGRFIFFDQPSQVYFPSDQSITGDLSEVNKDEDRMALKKLFEWIFRIVGELAPDLQIIITDHADIHEEWFQSAIIDDKWRGEKALIPIHWYS
ncbi:MAG: DUF3732 domain-containing protein [Methyloligellaceae bacterium]